MADPEPTRSWWPRLFRCTTADGAAAEVAERVGGGALRIDPDDAPLDRDSGAGLRFIVRRRDGAVPDPAWVREAESALEAWHAARAEIDRAEAGARGRARELEALYALGRALSEARTPARLFAVTAAALHRDAGVDTAAFVHALEGAPRAEVFASRPVPGAEIAAGAASWARGLPGGGPAPEARIHRMPAFDEAEEGEGTPFHPDDAVVIPLLRRGAVLANLVVFAPDAGSERRLRFFFGAANHVSLHLDRVLTVAEAEEGRFHAVLDALPQAVFVTDPARRIVLRNAAASALEPRVTGEAGRLAARIGDLDLEAAGRAVLRDGATAGGEGRLADGSVLDVAVSLLDRSGAPAALVFVIADVSEARRLCEQVAQSEKLSSLGRMLSGVAHELNNPLASVMGFAQLAQSAPASESLPRRLEIIRREAERCTKIVRTLLRFARRYEPERKPLSVNEVVESVLELVRYPLRVSGIDLAADLAPDLPVVLGDAHELRQAVLNLVNNAEQAIAGTGRKGSVTVRTRRDGDRGVVLEVADDGPGIPEAVRSRVFDPFFTTKPPGQGTGLGLSLVYGTAKAHGGDVELETREGEGTTFRVRIPTGEGSRAIAEPPEADEAGWRGGISARILVADDESAIASLISETLTADGHRVAVACTAEEVLRRLGEETFDVLVSDLKMPGLGARRLVDEVRRLRPGLERRLVITSGDTVSREPEAVAASVGAEVIHKPFAVDELRRVVRRRLERPSAPPGH